MSLLYLASALREHGLEPVVLDANAFCMTDDQIIAQVQSLRPLIVGLSLYSEILRQVRDISGLVRKACPSARIVLGGPHATAVPRQTMACFPDVDYVLTGEAEDSLPMLCKAVQSRGPEAKIPGLFYRDADRILEAPPAQFPDVNRLPEPARDLVANAYQQKRYYTLMVR